MIYFKDNLHKIQTNVLLDKFGIKNVFEDIEYGSFAYVIAATYKTIPIIQTIDESNTINLDQLYNIISVFSFTEQNMIHFALQCFNNSISDIKISDVFRSLDDSNIKVIKQAIDIRY